ncbi:MAG: DUF378 domain-containing protein [Candidatus Uhrbacteria bacterium]|nr:DUF378 domain-containing protein [Candidatus Uhrbacteria bacterium]
MMNGQCCGVHKVAWVLVIIGALNWGLIGLVKFDAVTVIFGAWPMLVRVIFVLVGLSALAMLTMKMCKGCTKKV